MTSPLLLMPLEVLLLIGSHLENVGNLYALFALFAACGIDFDKISSAPVILIRHLLSRINSDLNPKCIKALNENFANYWLFFQMLIKGSDALKAFGFPVCKRDWAVIEKHMKAYNYTFAFPVTHPHLFFSVRIHTKKKDTVIFLDGHVTTCHVRLDSCHIVENIAVGKYCYLNKLVKRNHYKAWLSRKHTY